MNNEKEKKKKQFLYVTTLSWSLFLNWARFVLNFFLHETSWDFFYNVYDNN